MASSLLAGERDVLELVATGADLQDILTSLCAVIDEQSGLASSVYLLDRAGKRLSFTAGPKVPDAWRRATASFDATPTNTACGAAVHARKMVYVENAATSPLFAPWADSLRGFAGMVSVWSTPFFATDGRVLGTFAMYSREVRRPTDTDLHLVERAGHLASIAVEQYQLDQDLRESERRFSTAFYSSPASMTIHRHADGRIMYVNDTFSAILGYSRGETVGQTALGMGLWAHPEQRADLMRLLDEKGVAQEFEAQFKTKSGRIVDGLVWMARIQILGEECVLGITCDITERKRNAERIIQSERLLRSLSGSLMRAQDDERRRIAHVLHETTAQDLAALKMHLARLNRSGAALSADERAAIAESIDLAERSMTGIRTLSYLLHPPFLDESGLVSALKWYADGFAERSGIHVDLDLPSAFERLPQDVETALFRVVQEALLNIHHHAHSASAAIRLHAGAGELTLEVEDRGRGVPAELLAQLPQGGGALGVGVAGMRERLEQLGGTLEIVSSGQGTTVRARIPLPEDRP